MNLQVDKFRLVARTMSYNKAETVCKALVEICPMYGIDSADVFHEFIANVLEECSEFRVFEENMNYKTPERIMAVWPGRFRTRESALPYVRNPQKLANFVYGNRMGNVLPNDGWDMRGSGPIQLTGRSMMTLFTVFYNKKFGTKYTIQEIAVLLRTDLKVGIHSACWVFAVSKNLIDLAIRDDFKIIVKRIVGGSINLTSRAKYYSLAVQHLNW